MACRVMALSSHRPDIQTQQALSGFFFNQVRYTSATDHARCHGFASERIITASRCLQNNHSVAGQRIGPAGRGLNVAGVVADQPRGLKRISNDGAYNSVASRINTSSPTLGSSLPKNQHAGLFTFVGVLSPVSVPLELRFWFLRRKAGLVCRFHGDGATAESMSSAAR
jgi:hypothetical protein